MNLHKIVLFFILIIFLGMTVQSQKLFVELESELKVGFEECKDNIIFSLDKPAEDTIEYKILFSGTAIHNTDYDLSKMIDTLTFEMGEDKKTVEINYWADVFIESSELINISYSEIENKEDTGSITIELFDSYNQEIEISEDTLYICNYDETLTLTAQDSMGFLEWESPFEIIDGEGTRSITYNIDKDGYVKLISKIGLECDTRDSVYVNFVGDEELTEIKNDREYLCLGSSEQIDVDIEPSNADIIWTPSYGISDTTIESPVFNPEVTTTYYLSVTTKHCMYEDTFTMQVDSIPSVGLKAVPPAKEPCFKFCEGQIIKLTSDELVMTELFPDIAYEWTPIDDIKDRIDTLQSVIITATETKTYTRKTINNECMAEDTIRIEVIDALLPIITKDTTVCYEHPVQLEIDDTDLTKIEWSPEEGLSCTDCPNPIATVGKTTTFTVKAEKEECCPVEAQITITVKIPNIPIEPQLTCPNVDIQTDMGLISEYTDPKWTSNIESLSCDDCFDPIANVNQTTNFDFEAIDTAGCLSRGVMTVNVYPPINFSLTVEPTSVPVGGNVKVTLITDPELDSENTWTINGEPLSGKADSITVKIIEKGNDNTVAVEFVDQNGCLRQAQIKITGLEAFIDIPNAFTPNGDNVNDLFRPIVINADFIPGFIQEFKVANRFGRVVYEYENGSLGWDGTILGERNAPPEVYLYYVKLRFPNGDTEFVKGDVTLIR